MSVEVEPAAKVVAVELMDAAEEVVVDPAAAVIDCVKELMAPTEELEVSPAEPREPANDCVVPIDELTAPGAEELTPVERAICGLPTDPVSAVNDEVRATEARAFAAFTVEG